MTKEEFEKSNNVKLIPAPITGGADIQLTDYMDSMELALSEGFKKHCIFSYSEGLYIFTYEESENKVLITRVYGKDNLQKVVNIVQEELDKGDADGDTIIEALEDYTIPSICIINECLFVPEYEEFYENESNEGVMKLAYKLNNDEKEVRKAAQIVANYIEPDNQIISDCSIALAEITPECDVRFSFWYVDTEN